MSLGLRVPPGFQTETTNPNEINGENQTPTTLPSRKKKKEKCAACRPSWFVQGTVKVSQIHAPYDIPRVATLAPGRATGYPSMGMDCSKSDPKSSLYKGGKWERTMSGYIALKAVSFSVCLLHSARSVDTLHINCVGKRKETGCYVDSQ